MSDVATRKPWLNAIAAVIVAVIVGVLVMLSLILAATTLIQFTNAQTWQLAAVLGRILIVALGTMGVFSLV